MNTAPQFWETKNILSTALLPLGWVYCFASSMRSFINTPYKASVPVLCVGNITVGGTGKTPLCMALANDLAKVGYKNIFIASKGYGGIITQPTRVTPSKHTSADAGDEPLLMARHHNVVVSKCRKAGVKFAETLGADIIIMDDGLQNPTVYKDKTIVVIDALKGFANRRIFPAGPMRQHPQKPLSNSNAVVFTTPNTGCNIDVNALGLAQYNIDTKKQYTAHFKVTKHPFKDRQSVVAFAGIGNPDKFFESVRSVGYPIRAKASYPDHHAYTDKDIENLQGVAGKALAKLITTEKDFVRLTPKQQKDIAVLPITLDIHPNTLTTNLLKDL